MKCYICNATLSPPEINYNNDHKDWEPCSRCLEVVQGVFNDDPEDEIDRQINKEMEDDDDEDFQTKQTS